MMLRQLESEDAPIPNTEEETNAWTVLDCLGTIANDCKEHWKGGVYISPRYKLFKKYAKNQFETNDTSFSYHKIP